MCQHHVGLLESLYISPACGLCFSQVVDPARRRYSDGELQLDLEAQVARKVAAKSAATEEKLKLKLEKEAQRKIYDKILARQRKLHPRENFAKA
jgi:hypothetical protein